MIRHAHCPTAEPYVPAEFRSLRVLREAAAECRGCELYKHATQVVFGEGPRKAQVMMVGEVPGDQEDRQGHPFVGPAGRILDSALQEAGIERDHVYVTNAVKHFKFTLRGKRRLHKKPSAMEIRACRPWLEAEVAAIKPPVLIALGATAGQSLFGPAFRVTRQHGKVFESEWAPHCMGTVHPSAVLRALQDADRRRMYRDFVDDLRHVAKFVRG